MTGVVGGGGGGGWRKGGPGKRNVDRGGWGWWIDGGVGGRECWRPRASASMTLYSHRWG